MRTRLSPRCERQGRGQAGAWGHLSFRLRHSRRFLTRGCFCRGSAAAERPQKAVTAALGMEKSRIHGARAAWTSGSTGDKNPKKGSMDAKKL